MDDRSMQFRVGVLVFASAIITLVLSLLFFGGFRDLGRSTRIVHVRFPDAPGVNVDTPVRKSGILIGRVRKVELNPKSAGGGVTVTAWIDRSRDILRSEICRITSKSLLGDSMLEFVPGPADANLPDEVIEADEFMVDGVVATDAIESLQNLASMVSGLETDVVEALNSVERAGDAIQTAGREVSQVANSLNQFVTANQPRVDRVLEQVESSLQRFEGTLESANTLVNSINEFVGDEGMRRSIQNAVQELPLMLRDAREFIGGLERVADEAEQNLNNLQGLTAALGEKGPDLVAALAGGIGRVDELVDEFISVAQTLRDGRGTFHELLNNPELYQRLNHAVANIELITTELRPIIRDARTFTDKIARDPGRLGVKGILDRRASGTKLSAPVWSTSQ